MVDRDVDQHRSRAHPANHVARHQLRSGRARHQDGTDNQVGSQHRLFNRRGGGEQGRRPRTELQVEFLQPRQRLVDDGDAGLQAHRHARGVGAGHAASEHHHLGGRHTGDAAKQDAGTALLTLQAMRANLDRHSTGDLAHRRQQGQGAGAVGHRFIGDAGCPTGQ